MVKPNTMDGFELANFVDLNPLYVVFLHESFGTRVVS
jgi:hypothetical protein